MHGVDRLRQARLARGLTLEAISSATRLPPHIVEKVDAGDFAELPPGIYARAYVRSVASVLGLDGDAVVAELGAMLPPAPDPLPLLREIAREPILPPLGPRASRSLAAVVDGLVLVAITGVLVLLTRACIDTTIVEWTVGAALGLVIAAALVATPYFVLMRGLARTAATHPVPEITMRAVAATTVRVFLEETSILFDLLWSASSLRSSPREAPPARGAKLPHELTVG